MNIKKHKLLVSLISIISISMSAVFTSTKPVHAVTIAANATNQAKEPSLAKLMGLKGSSKTQTKELKAANKNANPTQETEQQQDVSLLAPAPKLKTETKKTLKAKSKTKKRKAVVNLAQKQVGKSYVWGAAGPNSFDCSGLTEYVYLNTTGKDISRTTYTQVYKGKQVALNKLKKGDLLFFGQTTAPYHVAIYAGNNQMIHAANPTQGVIKQTISKYFYPSAAKRII